MVAVVVVAELLGRARVCRSTETDDADFQAANRMSVDEGLARALMNWTLMACMAFVALAGLKVGVED